MKQLVQKAEKEPLERPVESQELLKEVALLLLELGRYLAEAFAQAELPDLVFGSLKHYK
jgi:hypothetical protein